MCLLCVKLEGPLPSSYEAFKEGIEELFPVLVDTKYLAASMRKMDGVKNHARESMISVILPRLWYPSLTMEAVLFYLAVF